MVLYHPIRLPSPAHLLWPLRLALATIIWGVPPSLAAALAQDPGPTVEAESLPGGPQVVEGRLLLGDAVADSGTVVLHRVTPEEASAVDSVEVTGGGFQLRLPHLPVPGSGEVFFASHRYQGILYFGPALAMAEQVDSVYTIRAYSTRAAPPQGLALPVAVRNLFVEEGPMGWRVTDLVEIRNDSSVTWIPDPESTGAVVWSYPLAPDASSFRLGDGDLAPGSVTWEDGMVRVRAPILPGERLLVFHYEIPSLETEFPLPGVTEILELLVRQPAPPLRVDALQAAGPMEIERGVNYFRWWGQGLQDQVVQLRPGEDRGIPMAWVAVGIAFVLTLVGGWLVVGPSRPSFGAGGLERRGEGVRGKAGDTPGSGPGPGASSPADGVTPFVRRRSLLLAIARLDEEGSAAAAKAESPEARRRREVQREALLTELQAVEAELEPEDAQG